jgi:sporulation protein YlmC with PRC-barrel domain
VAPGYGDDTDRTGARDRRVLGRRARGIPADRRQTRPPTIKRAATNPTGMDAEPQEITTLVGREVYSNNGVFVGEVEDIRLDLDVEAVTGLALHELNHELFDDRAAGSRGVIIPYRWVRAVGDVVLVNDIVERLSETTDEEEAAV